MNRLTSGETTMLLLALAIAILLVALFFYAVRKAQIAKGRSLTYLFGIGLTVWLSAVALLSELGWLAQWQQFPPRVPMLVVVAIVTYTLISTSRTATSSIAAIPLWLPVLIQSFRIVVEIALWQLHREGIVPQQFTFEGRNVDIIVGLSAPLVAWSLSRGWIGPRTIVAWNMLGLVVLINAMATAATSSPGPQHLDWPGEPFTAIATWPLIWLPSFLAPTAVFLHFVSLRQNLSAM